MISYIGGKYRMAKWIGGYVPNNIELFAEIFGGAFWTYLKSDVYKIPTLKEVHYNDFNRLMVNMFACSKDTSEFAKHFEKIESQKNELFNTYRDKVIGMQNDKTINDIKIPNYDLGYQYPYLLTQVFSGVGVKPNTKMTDLKGKYKSKFESFRNRLTDPKFTCKLEKITECHNLDFEKAVERLDSENAFLYFDPPYYDTETYYSFHDFGRDDHLRLADTMKNMKGLFALSYYEFDELKEWFPPVELKVEEDKKGNTTVLNEEEVIKALSEGKYVWVKKDFAKARSAKKGVKQNKGTELLILNYYKKEDGTYIRRTK